MENDIKLILSTLIDLSIRSDCEMVNMGDWSWADLDKVVAEKTKIMNDLKDPNSDMRNVPPKFLYQAMHDLALYLRTFGPDRDMDTMQQVEHKIASHIWRHYRTLDRR